jgi:hypothetical protein
VLYADKRAMKPNRHADDEIPDVLPAEGGSTRHRRPVTEVVWWRAERLDGTSFQAGLAVLRPGYFAFLPTLARQNMIMNLSRNFVENVVNVTKFDFENEQRYDAIFDHLFHQDSTRFDDAVRSAVQRAEGGVLWLPGETAVSRAENPVGPREWDAIRFRAGPTCVQGTPPRDRLPAVRRILREWSLDLDRLQATNQRQALACATGAGLLSLATAVCIWGLFAGRMAPDGPSVLYYGLTSGLGVLALLCWILTIWLMRRDRQQASA